MTPLSLHNPFDVVIVGARCAGATLATRLARGGWRVALLDRDTFPSDTISTHVMFPDTLEELGRLGVLERLHSRHDLTPVRYSWRVLGQEVAGTFTPVGAHDRCLSVRRVALDAVMVELAAEAGALVLEGTRVAGLLGAGTPEDPVRGVELEDGRRILARWVVGADGQRSTVARRLGVPATGELRGEMAFLLGYWRGLPPSGWCRIDMHARSGIMSVPVEDGLHLLSVAGPVETTRGTPTEREQRYRDLLAEFPAVLNPRLLAGAELVSGVVAVPETMMRGHFRQATGPGWVLIGDAGHLKHPSTAQGIGDAVHQARYVAEDLLAGGDLSRFARWRDARAEPHHGWSFQAAHFPPPEAAGLYAGIAADPAASQAFLDTFTKQTSLADVLTAARTARWHAASAYEDGLARVIAALAEPEQVNADGIVPACPEWTVRDLVAHLVGVAEDWTRGAFFPGATEAWRDPAVAEQREHWTADHLTRRTTALPRLRADLAHHGQELVEALRRGHGPATEVPDWMLSAPVADLAVHLDDLREALGQRPVPEGAVTAFGFAVYRGWLRVRAAEVGLPPLLLDAGERSWAIGRGEPAAIVRAPAQELFRAITGRRSAAQIRALDWVGDPEPYLRVLSPYPLPADPAPLG